jgi:hypothetical protein
LELISVIANAGVGSSEVRLGDNLQITLNLNAPDKMRDITYLVSKVERVSSRRRTCLFPCLCLCWFMWFNEGPLMYEPVYVFRSRAGASW